MASRLSQPWATLPRQASAEAKAGGHELPLQTSLLPFLCKHFPGLRPSALRALCPAETTATPVCFLHQGGRSREATAHLFHLMPPLHPVN